jgi:3-hydroxybutyryl-CoA dehydrogenase
MTIAVIGAGAMGSGIAQVAAMAGHDVLLYDTREASIVKGVDGIRQSLNLLASKGRITDAEATAVFGRIFPIDKLESIRDAGLVIEAIIESEPEKQSLFALVEPLVSEETILATNTSSLSVTALARPLKRPERFVGLHFFNPPVLMKLVEVVPALQTAPTVRDEAADLMRSWGKVAVIARDTPGFIVNRIARPYYSEALRIAEEQLATPATIDEAMRRLGGFRMGPFELMDFIGHDVNEAVTRSVWTATQFEPRYAPSSLQVNLVRAGWLGRKTGRGFYDYSAGAPERPDVPSEQLQPVFERILTMLIHEAADALYYGIAGRDDIDAAMTLGVNYPKGLLAWGDALGPEWCVDQIDALFSTYREGRYRGSPLLRRMAQRGQRFFT